MRGPSRTPGLSRTLGSRRAVRRDKRLLTRRWEATTAPTTTQWKAEVMEWRKAEGAALRREDNSGMRECPVAPDWDKLVENFETLSEEEDE
ncbi:hypothetical protein NDU88_000185 [Pleurodeles waltl]|uniref:Uncharacterized protein n=1 Tax=Pleurodeles waltl TaxID=8319 RepID=A0AAV7UQK2_PLEWA|nr:hypothetical protein NDU88_000185 [Pleurodeles waltl]